MSTVRFSRVYCYMKIQGYLRLVNVTMIYYTMNLLSLLTDTPIALQRYASDGAITDKVCRRKCTEGRGS